MQKLMMTVEEVAREISVSRTTIYKLRERDPSFPEPLYVTPKAVRWRRSDILAWLESKAAGIAA